MKKDLFKELQNFQKRKQIVIITISVVAAVLLVVFYYYYHHMQFQKMVEPDYERLQELQQSLFFTMATGLFAYILFVISLYLASMKRFQRRFVNIFQKHLLQSEQKLLQSHAYQKAIVEALPQLVVVTDGKKAVATNSKLVKFFGYENLEAFHKDYDCICDLFVQNGDYLQKQMGSLSWIEYLLEPSSTINKVQIQQNGLRYTFLVKAQEIDYNDSFLAVATLTDITEDELIKVRYGFALESGNDGIWDWNLEDNSVFFSKKYKQMLGYSDEEMPNDLHQWRKRIHPKDIADTDKAFKASVNGDDAKYEAMFRLKHKDGHWVWIYSRAKVVRNHPNKAIRLVGIHTDVTGLKLQQFAINRLQSVLDYSPFGVMTTDKYGKIEYCNIFICNLMGYSQPELHGSYIKDYMAKDKDEVVAMIHDMIKKEGIFTGNLDVKRKDGSIYKEHNLIAPVYIDGVIDSYIGIKEKTHKLHQLQQTIKEKDKMLITQSRYAAMGEMIGMIAHQWRQPISNISMEANNILADIELSSLDEDVVQKSMQDILSQTQHLSQTIDDFRNFFKPDKHKRYVDVNDVIKESLSMMGKSFENNSIKVSCFYGQDMLGTIYDRELLQVVVNVLKNAKEAVVAQIAKSATSKHAEVKITTKKVDQNAVITVCDSGGGIDEKDFDHIFEPYFTTKEELNGTGLGLYMSKTIVQKHLHGTIKAYNRGSGACFELTIPLSYKKG